MLEKEMRIIVGKNKYTYWWKIQELYTHWDGQTNWTSPMRSHGVYPQGWNFTRKGATRKAQRKINRILAKRMQEAKSSEFVVVDS